VDAGKLSEYSQLLVQTKYKEFSLLVMGWLSSFMSLPSEILITRHRSDRDTDLGLHGAFQGAFVPDASECKRSLKLSGAEGLNINRSDIIFWRNDR
jgi:hypothetical protein